MKMEAETEVMQVRASEHHGGGLTTRAWEEAGTASFSSPRRKHALQIP